MNEANLLSSCLIGQGWLALSLHFTQSVIHGGSAKWEQIDQWPFRRMKEPTGNLFISGSAFQTANSDGFGTLAFKYIIYFYFFPFTSGSDRVIYRFARLFHHHQKRKSLPVGSDAALPFKPSGRFACFAPRYHLTWRAVRAADPVEPTKRLLRRPA